jgi:hypothetical protein
MSRSLSWRLTWPLCGLRDVAATTLNAVGRRYNSLFARAPQCVVTAFGMRPEDAKRKLDPHVNYLANLIRTSGFFDADAYDAAPEARAEGLDPALHYVLVGEGRTLKPSAAFDPVYYGERYPEVAAWGGNRLGHYLEWGSAQGRRALPIADTLNFPLTGIIPDRPTVIEGYSG